MSKNFPQLSVVINNYNYDNYVLEALDSALDQLKEGDELIVVDDGSTDNSKELLKRYKELNGCILIEQQNQGQLNAVRNGIAAASGDVIVLLDSDDSFLDGYLETLRNIYQQYPDTHFTFSEPDVRGADAARVKETRDILQHMAFPPGKVGKTKWAAILAHEFVGVPTSGLSLSKPLADKIMTIPESVDKTVKLSATKRFVLGISAHEASNFGFSADAIIVRCASALGVDKYHNEQPGFIYRIHGLNKYAVVPKWGRWYMRKSRKSTLTKIFCDHFAIDMQPSCEEVFTEFQQRSLPIHRRRRLRLRWNYTRALALSRGTIVFKLSAILFTMGIQRCRPPGL